MALKKRPTKLPTMTVTFEAGPLVGHEFLMHEPPSELIFGPEEVRRSDFGRMAIEAVVDSTLEVPPGRMPASWAMALGTGWLEAWRRATFPPVNGQLSETPSFELPSTSPAA